MMMRLIAVLAALLIALPATAQQAYRIRPGDTLRVEVVEDPGLNRTVLVAPDGRITVPLAGAVVAAGRPVEAVQAELARMLAPNFAATPSVFVAVERIAEPRVTAAVPVTIAVHVIGEAGRPGRLEVLSGTNILQLFAEMGGFSRFAAVRRVQLRRPDGRGGEMVIPIDFRAIERGETNAGMTVLREGDVILVPQRSLFE